MSEPCDGPAPGAWEGRSVRNAPLFVVGSEDDEQDMGQVETGMRNEMFREEEMEDDEDGSVSCRCLFMCAACVKGFLANRCIMRCNLYLSYFTVLRSIFVLILLVSELILTVTIQM